MSRSTTSVVTTSTDRPVLTLRLRNEFDEELKRVNDDIHRTATSLERDVEANRHRLEGMSEADLDAFIDERVNLVRDNLNKQVDRLSSTIKSKKPKKPTRDACASDEEFNEKTAQYEEEVTMYKTFVSYATSILDKIVTWITNICESVVQLFHNLWTWLVQKLADIGTKVMEAVRFIKSQFDRFWEMIFN